MAKVSTVPAPEISFQAIAPRHVVHRCAGGDAVCPAWAAAQGRLHQPYAFFLPGRL
jgi:hypothetical protein